MDENLIKEDIVECCKQILESNDWRERSSLILQFPSFANILGEENFTKMYLDIIKECLSDRVFFIRKETINVIKELSTIFGVGWFCKNILDYLYAFKSDQNYLHRETPLFTFIALNELLVKGLSGVSDYKKILESIVEFICEYTEDKICNLRLLALETFWKLIDLYSVSKSDCLKVVKQIRKIFKKEKDVEVINYIKLIHKKTKNICLN